MIDELKMLIELKELIERQDQEYKFLINSYFPMGAPREYATKGIFYEKNLTMINDKIAYYRRNTDKVDAPTMEMFE